MLLTQERPVVTQLLREHPYALFVFSNKTQNRWHFINVKYDSETKRRRLFRRISVKPEDRLRTASERLALIDIGLIDAGLFDLSPLAIQERQDQAFDVEAVTKEFFAGYEDVFRTFENDLGRQGLDRATAHDYALQFMNRTMFLYFIQRKLWLGNDNEFLRTFWEAYKNSRQPRDTFVEKWLNVLFLEAFNRKPTACHRHFPKEINEVLALAPYLNGGLYTENSLDRECTALISDRRFEEIFGFFERYNFTVAEDSLLDKEVAVDPEMIGKVYESLVNVSEEVDERGEAGIFYTPRTEIDLMCRLTLANYFSNHLKNVSNSLLNQLVFSLDAEEKDDADRAISAANLWPEIRNLLQEIAVVDPACGSGSFLVGMLHILDDLFERSGRILGTKEDSFERKKRIIGRSLYGVDVMDWACHVAELRLWLAMIVDYDVPLAELRFRQEPLLPHFSFKIRCGDSLVQEIAGVNLGLARHSLPISQELKARIRSLKSEKLKYFNNDETCRFRSLDDFRKEEKRLFLAILEERQEEIKERLNTLKRRREIQPQRQIRLNGKVDSSPHQMVMESGGSDQESEALIEELDKAKAASEALRTAPTAPFVWDIAFVEIFEEEKKGFDIVIGNPPYVRQEYIAAPLVHGVRITKDKKEYKDKLAHVIYRTYKNFFGYRTKNQSVVHKLDAKSDLYIYFYFVGLSLLNPKGSFSFVTSNSWLDVGYGADLQEFLLKHAHVKLILDNQVKRTFAGADVNTIIVLLSVPDDRREWALEETARFVMFRVPYEYVVSPVIFDEVEDAEERKAIQEYRVFPIKQDRLLEDGCASPEDEEADTRKGKGPLIKVARYIGNKWGGKYLRAPDIYWTILEKGKGKLVRLGDVAEVRRGFTTGANEFFYLDKERIREWGIENDFLRPVIKSPRDYYSIRIHGSDIQLFWCQKDINFLRGTKALEYIKWGEANGFHRVPSCRSRKRWYSLSGPDKPTMLWPSAFFERHIVYECPKSYVADKVFYTISGPISILVKAWLNCSIVSLLIEVEGYQLNHGGIFVTTEWLSNLPVLNGFDKNIEDIFQEISKRNILLCEDEHKLDDRQQLDEYLVKYLSGKADIEIIKQVYAAIEEYVDSRIHKARRKTTKLGRQTLLIKAKDV